MIAPNSSVAEGLPLRPMSVLAVAACVTILYTTASLENEFIYDDHEVILNQPIPASLSDIASLFGERHFPSLPYYRPVTRMSFMLQKMLHGDSAVLFHAANALLMGLTVILAYSVLRLPRLQIAPLPALLAAALFAVHPIASACVYPIASGRETLLPVLLTLSCVSAFFRGSRKSYWLGVVCFAAALFSKEQIIVLPLLLVWGDILRLSANPVGRQPRAWAARYWPFGLIVICYLVTRWYLFRGSEVRLAIDDWPTAPLWSFGYAAQTICAPFSSLLYEPPVEVWLSWMRLLVAVSLLCILGVLSIRNWHRLKTPLSFFGLWFALSLLPTANVLEQEARFAERYVYLALLAVLGAFAALISLSEERQSFKRVVVSVVMTLIVLSSYVSWNRGAYYRDELAFFGQWVHTNPNSANARVHFGMAWNQANRPDLAIEYLQSALDRDSKFSGAHINLANLLFTQAKFEDALRHYRSGLVGLEREEQRAGVHYNMGNVYLATKRFEKARIEYSVAVELNPGLYDGFVMLGEIDRQSGRLLQAEQNYRRALRAAPEDAPLRLQIQELIRACNRPK